MVLVRATDYEGFFCMSAACEPSGDWLAVFLRFIQTIVLFLRERPLCSWRWLKHAGRLKMLPKSGTTRSLTKLCYKLSWMKNLSAPCLRTHGADPWPRCCYLPLYLWLKGRHKIVRQWFWSLIPSMFSGANQSSCFKRCSLEEDAQTCSSSERRNSCGMCFGCHTPLHHDYEGESQMACSLSVQPANHWTKLCYFV